MRLRLETVCSSLLRSLLSAVAVIAFLGLAAPSTHAQTGGRSISRTYQADKNPSSEQTFHNGDNPAEGATGGVGGWDPTQPPTGTWVYSGGNMYVVGTYILWRYTNWHNETGEIWYQDDSGWHYWGTWKKKGTFALSPDSTGEEGIGSWTPGPAALAPQDARGTAAA